MARHGTRRKRNGKPKIVERPPTEMTASSTIFMPAPIDWTFVPYTRRAMLRRELPLIYALPSTVIGRIFPYIMVAFQKDAVTAEQ